MRLGGVATRSPHYVASTTARRAVGRRFGVVVGLLACSGRLLLDQKTARLGFNAAAGSPLVLVGSGRHAHNDALAVGAEALDALARDVPIGVLQLYEKALAVKRNLLVTEPGSISTAASEAPGATDEDLLRYFKPKSDSDYIAHLEGRQLRKTRRYERLVASYGKWVASMGFQPSTLEYPKDLTLRKTGCEWLVEAKVVRQGNATQAVREAIGQLLSYSHFLYDDEKPYLLGLFTEFVGEGCAEFLATLGISAVWFDRGRWVGSSEAVA